VNLKNLIDLFRDYYNISRGEFLNSRVGDVVLVDHEEYDYLVDRNFELYTLNADLIERINFQDRP